MALPAITKNPPRVRKTQEPGSELPIEGETRRKLEVEISAINKKGYNGKISVTN